MAGVPYVFGNATTSIPLSNLDANFNTGLTIGNTTVGLGNTVTTLGNVTIANATTISAAGNVFLATSSGNVGIGTSSPAKILSVSGADAVFRLIDTNGNTTDIGSNSTGTSFRNFGSGAFRFQNAAGVATLNLDTNGNVTITGSLGTSQTAGIIGTTTNNNANAGSVGEYIESTVGPYTVTTATSNPTSLSLTAGDWDVTVVTSGGGASATSTESRIGINTTAGTMGTQATDHILYVNDTVNGASAGMFTKRISLSATTTVYASQKTDAGTNSFQFCVLSARRRR